MLFMCILCEDLNYPCQSCIETRSAFDMGSVDGYSSSTKAEMDNGYLQFIYNRAYISAQKQV